MIHPRSDGIADAPCWHIALENFWTVERSTVVRLRGKPFWQRLMDTYEALIDNVDEQAVWLTMA